MGKYNFEINISINISRFTNSNFIFFRFICSDNTIFNRFQIYSFQIKVSFLGKDKY